MKYDVCTDWKNHVFRVRLKMFPLRICMSLCDHALNCNFKMITFYMVKWFLNAVKCDDGEKQEQVTNIRIRAGDVIKKRLNGMKCMNVVAYICFI